MASDNFDRTHGELVPGGGPRVAGSTAYGTCSRCHQPLTRPSTAGGCLRCIANFIAVDEDRAFDPLVGGEEVRCYSHFEIELAADGTLAELGHGAMGTTYRALDTVLQSPVALKIISRNVADSPDVRSRFLREARAAARLRHPHVASVFHYGEQDGECFYVMELVEGETLEERVCREGPLPATLALEVAIQITAALSAAEMRGIVHRDLKPSNVMLTANGHGDADGTPSVKVIDFGLAKAVATGAEVPGLGDTRGGFVGTPAFASPEQFARTPDERIDTRSDIYSLGVTLWYLLCGKMPFVGKTLTEVHEQQTRQPLPLAQLRVARVPSPVVALLRAMLAVAPAARPQSARELLDVLHRCQQQLLRVSLARFARLAGVLALCALTILGLFLWREHTREQAAPPDRSIAVLPFENLSPDPADTFFTTGVQDEIAADLAQLPELTVISPRSTKEYLPGKERDLGSIGRALGVACLLEGSARREGSQMHIILHLVDLHDLTHPWSQRYDRQLTDTFAVQGEIARAITDQLQLSLSSAEKASINRPPTSDLTAYELYLRSRTGPEIFPDETAVRHDAERRVALLDQAVARDPKFMLAYCKLTSEHDAIWSNSGGATPDELAVDHRTLAEVCLQKARELQPDAGEVHLAVADHLIDIQDTSGQVLVEADLARRALPNSSTAEMTAGDAYADYGRWEDALRAYKRAVALDPRGSLACWSLAQTYESMRRYDDYDRTMTMLLPLAPANEKAEMILERARGPAEARADLAPLRAALAGIPDADDPDGSTRRDWSLVVKLCEHDPAGVSHFLAANNETTLWSSGVPYPKPWFEALAALMRGDKAGAQAALTVARPTMEKLVAERPRSGTRLSMLAMIDAGLGRKEDAWREARQVVDLCPSGTLATQTPVIYCNLAVVYAWTGLPDLAFATLDKTVRQPASEGLFFQPSYGDFQLNPLWDALRSDPRFAALVAQLAPPHPR